jgi:hypothetical protein
LLERASVPHFEARGELVSSPGWTAISNDLHMLISPTLTYAFRELRAAGLISHTHYTPIRGAARRAYYVLEPAHPPAAGPARARSLLKRGRHLNSAAA